VPPKNIRVLLVIASASFLGIFLYFLLKPINLNHEVIYQVKKGATFNLIVEDLKNKRILKNPLVMKIYGRITGKTTSIHAGEYLLDPSLNVYKLTFKFTEGDIFYRQVRIREGIQFKTLIKELKVNDHLLNDINGKSIKEIINLLEINFHSLEGLFFPDTYFFSKGDSISNLLLRAHKKQQLVINFEWDRRSTNLPFKSPYEALILASIIEKEGLEKKEISGVFIRRINQKMKLQADPTVIFALGESYDGNIKRSHLKMEHPYNTYHIEGLPPGPIGLSSRESLQAALNPKEGTSLYFVAKGDGSHYFSDTLEEHLKAVRRYQLNL